MDEEAIRRDVEALFRKKLMRMHERAVRVDAMSDEEYKAFLLGDGELTEKTKKDLEYCARQRMPSRFADRELVEQAILGNTDRLLPFVIANREKSNSDGPVTIEEMRYAEGDRALAWWQEHRDRVLGHVAEHDDPIRLERLKALLVEAEEKIEALRAKRDQPF